MSDQGPQQQGALFEELFYDLMLRVLRDDLGYEVIQHSQQGSGIQYGKDLQTRWRTSEGNEIFWHFECKSHRGGTLHQKEVADKVIDVFRSMHQIHVWCLVLAHVEPGQWIDEFFPWAARNLGLTFSLEVLSPQRNFIKLLFACHGDLYRALYPGEPVPSMSERERQLQLEAFARFLSSATSRGEEAALGKGKDEESEWELVLPGRMRLMEDDVDEARAYLKGDSPTCPWEAIAYGWAVPRRSAEQPIVDRIEKARPGFEYLWLLGPGGEGKSTILRRVAWEIARDTSDCVVLWTDRYAPRDEARIPLEWIEQLRDKSRVLLCVDGSLRLRQAGALLSRRQRYAAAGKQVFLLIADRSYDRNRSRVRSDLRDPGTRSNPNRQWIDHLTAPEANALADNLSTRGLLYEKTVEEAAERIVEAGNRLVAREETSWLLPTILQLTDPEDREFDKLLETILDGVAGIDQDSLRLLLAASLVHAADVKLPRELAERLLKGSGGLGPHLATLKAEIQRIRGTSAASSYVAGDLVTYHRVVADGYIGAAALSENHADALYELCRDIPAQIKPRLNPNTLLFNPQYYFVVLDNVADYLYREKYLFEAAAEFLTSWAKLDERQFPALHRVAECYSEWLVQEYDDASMSAESIEQLESSAREAFQEALRVARTVLTEPADTRPARFADYRLEVAERFCYHGWAILESRIGLQRRDRRVRRRGLLRAVLLAISAFYPDGGRDTRGAAIHCPTIFSNLGSSVLRQWLLQQR